MTMARFLLLMCLVPARFTEYRPGGDADADSDVDTDADSDADPNDPQLIFIP